MINQKITGSFRDLWKLYSGFRKGSSWDELIQNTKKIYADSGKEPIVMDFITAILKDLDRQYQ